MFDTTLFSSEIIFGLQKRLVGYSLTNQNYYGAVVSAAKVRVLGGTEITVNDYVRNGTIDFQTLGNAYQEMEIDKADYFAFKVDQLDELFSNPRLLESHVDNAVYQLIDKADVNILAAIAGAATAGMNIDATETDATAFAAAIREASRKLREANAPSQGRYAVLTPRGTELLEEYLGDKLRSVDDARAGFVGRFSGLDIFESNNLPVAEGVATAVYGHKLATTFANDMSEVKIVEPSASFGPAAKGLHVYGTKVFRPEIVGTIELDA